MNITDAEYFTFNIDNSLLLIGQSGSGKSFLVNQLVQKYIGSYNANDLQLIIIDMKGVEFTQLRAKNPDYIRTFIQFDAETGLNELESIYTLMIDRIAHKIVSPQLFLVIEECDMAALDQKRFDFYLTKINHAARMANTKVIYVTSSPRESVVSNELAESFDLILYGNLPNQDYDRLKLPNPPLLQPYEFAVLQTKTPGAFAN